MIKRSFLGVLVLLAFAGCSASPSTVPQSPMKPASLAHRGDLPTTPIHHVIIIIQENRSLDNLFNGYPGANTVRVALKHDGTYQTLQPVPLAQFGDISHTHNGYLVEYDGGKMDGFDIAKRKANHKFGIKPDPLTYSQQSDVQPYWDIASHNALADNFFASVSGPSYPAHLYLIAGGASDVIGAPNGRPWGCSAPAGSRTLILTPEGKQKEGPFPCFDWTTLADELDAAGLTWRFFAPFPAKTQGQSLSDWSTYQSISHIFYGPDWSKHVVNPETRILTAISKGELTNVSWVTPKNSNSDHSDNGRDDGPSWIASIVNAVGSSQYASSTAIFITWDEWGGWFDHVAPPTVDLYGLGLRVPLIIASGYTKPGCVSHAQHEFGSILRFTEENWGLGQLGPSDTRADNLHDCFDFKQSPHPLARIKAPLSASFFINQPPDDVPVDEDF